MNTKTRLSMLGALYVSAVSMAIPLPANASFVFSGGATQSLPVSGNDFNADMATLNFDQMTSGSQLSVTQDGFVDFYYIGAESGFTNTFTAGDYWVTENNEAFNYSGYSGFTTVVSAGDILDFRFTSNDSTALNPVDNTHNTNLQGLGIFFDSSQSEALAQVLIGYDDQTINDDDDFEDMLIRANFRPAVTQSSSAVVPVPAAFYLFGSGLLGLLGIFRRKKSA